MIDVKIVQIVPESPTMDVQVVDQNSFNDDTSRDKHKSFKWDDATTLHLIELRGQMRDRFRQQKGESRRAWEDIIDTMGLRGLLDHKQIAKKWDNLQLQYKRLRSSATEEGSDEGNSHRSRWLFYDAMDNAIGDSYLVIPPRASNNVDIQDYIDKQTSEQLTDEELTPEELSPPVVTMISPEKSRSDQVKRNGTKRKRERDDELIEYLLRSEARTDKLIATLQDAVRALLQLTNNLPNKPKVKLPRGLETINNSNTAENSASTNNNNNETDTNTNNVESN